MTDGPLDTTGKIIAGVLTAAVLLALGWAMRWVEANTELWVFLAVCVTFFALTLLVAVRLDQIDARNRERSPSRSDWPGPR